MIHDDCPTDLIAKERRNELSPLERRALLVHLARCTNCRAWQQIGRDFDRESAATSDDATLVQRIADGIRPSSVGPLARSTPNSVARNTRTVRWIVLAALASSAAAAAAVAGWQISRDVPPPEVDPSLTLNLERTVETPNPVRGNVAQAMPTLASVSQSESPRHDTLAVDAVRPAARSTIAANPVQTGVAVDGGRAEESAISLYREANQARRKGEVARAISVFRRLQQSFPRSPEAHLSNVALGGALLESGAARDALQQFDHYLASSGKKNLAAEALYGRARALGALRSRTDERAAWLQLSREFPRSPYSATATRRLQSLE